MRNHKLYLKDITEITRRNKYNFLINSKGQARKEFLPFVNLFLKNELAEIFVGKPKIYFKNRKSVENKSVLC